MFHLKIVVLKSRQPNHPSIPQQYLFVMSMKNIIHVAITALKCVNRPMPVLSNANPAVSALMAFIEIKKEFAFQKM